jgi:O-antigen/teichoic acid export membrane protein
MSDAINNQFSSKIIFRNSIVAIVQVIISTIIMFFLYSYLLREIGPDNLGLWSILMATANSLRVGEFGMSGSVVKFVAKYRANNDLESASKVIQTGFISLAVFLILILVILYPLLICYFQ